MKVKDVEPGWYWYQPSSSTKPDIVRVEGIAEREYKGERTKFRATRFLVSGPRPLRISADIILRPAEPTARHLAIIQIIEEQSEET